MLCGITGTFFKIHVNISAASSRFPWFPGWCTYIKRRRTMEGWSSALSMCTHEDFPFRYRATWRRGWYLGMVRVARQGRHTRFYDNRRAKTPLIPEMYRTGRNEPTFPSTVYAHTIRRKLLSNETINIV